MIQLPVLLLNTRDDATPIGVLDWLAVLVWLGCFLLEAAADNEKFIFRSDPDNKNKVAIHKRSPQMNKQHQHVSATKC